MRKLVLASAGLILLAVSVAKAAESQDPDVPTVALPDAETSPLPADAVAPSPQGDDDDVPKPHIAPGAPPGVRSPFWTPEPAPWVRPGQRGSRWTAPSYAPASDSADPDSAQPETKRQWYGWQTLLVDAGSVVFIATAIGSEESALVLAGTAGFFAGGPIVHAAHGHGGKAWGSFGLRAGASVGLAFVGYSLAGGDSCRGDLCGLAEAIYAGAGFILGAGTAIIIDAAIIANEDVKAERPRAAKFIVAPSVAATPKGAFTGLSGTF